MELISVLYPIRNLKKLEIENLNNSMNSFSKNEDFEIDFCISDCGSSNSEVKLRENLDQGFSFNYSKHSGHYGYSKAINQGVLNLVETDLFVIASPDVLVPKDGLSEIVKLFNENNKMFMNRCRILKKEIDNSLDYEKLDVEDNCELPVALTRRIFRLLSKKQFLEIKGYDEAFPDNFKGAEHLDFMFRYCLFHNFSTDWYAYNYKLFGLKQYNSINDINEKNKDGIKFVSSKLEIMLKVKLLIKKKNDNHNIRLRKTSLKRETMKYIYPIETSI